MYRKEKDTIGYVDVPADKLWAAQTQRSLEHFRISQGKMPTALIHALAQTKRAAAKVNMDLGLLPAERAEAIMRAADEVLDDRHPSEFPLSIWQTGSGTQTNMNLNEVLALRAIGLTVADLGRTERFYRDGLGLEQEFDRILDGLSSFAGRPLDVDEDVYASERDTGDRNRAIAYLMRSAGLLDHDVDDQVEMYFRQCSIVVTARDLAVMAATLAQRPRASVPIASSLV